jgi:carboxymethylenebutenolidase
MPPEQMERLEAAMQEAGVAFRAELYEGAAHGFTMADTAAFDEAATERHWQRLFALLARALTQL